MSSIGTGLAFSGIDSVFAHRVVLLPVSSIDGLPVGIVPSLRLLSCARPTKPSALIPPCIRLVIGVVPRAMRLHQAAVIPSQEHAVIVFRLRYWIQMIWIHACFVSALVVNVQPV